MPSKGPMAKRYRVAIIGNSEAIVLTKVTHQILQYVQDHPEVTYTEILQDLDLKKNTLMVYASRARCMRLVVKGTVYCGDRHHTTLKIAKKVKLQFDCRML